jgi:hypothetical protein
MAPGSPFVGTTIRQTSSTLSSFFRFDKAANRFTNFIHDNFGGVRLFNSSGWDGDTLTWTGDALANPPAATQRFVIESKSPKEFVISWEVRKPQADWVVGDRLTCHHQSRLTFPRAVQLSQNLDLPRVINVVHRDAHQISPHRLAAAAARPLQIRFPQRLNRLA